MAKTRANRSSLTPLLAIVTACLILFVAVLLIVLLGGGLERDNRSRRPAVVQSRPIVSSPPAARNRPVRPTRPKPSPVVQPQPPRPSDVDSPEPKFDVAPVVEQPPDSPSGDPSLAPATDGNMVAPDPVETFAVKPAPGTGTSDVPGFPAAPDTAPTEPAFPTDQGSTPASVPDDTGFPIGSKTEPDPKVPFAAPTEAVQPTRDEVTALAAALKAARTALFDHDFDGAEAELAKVESLSKLPEHHEKYERLYLLTQYARNFREALSKAIQSLEAGDEIEVGTSTVVGVVNTAADRITIRLSGANRDYSLETLPPGLAVAIADKWLNQDDPVSLVVKGAYLATIQDVGEERLARAREWWQDASRRGVDIGELEKVIDDTYDLEKDLTP
jgi:hypothetical protein